MLYVANLFPSVITKFIIQMRLNGNRDTQFYFSYYKGVDCLLSHGLEVRHWINYDSKLGLLVVRPEFIWDLIRY